MKFVVGDEEEDLLSGMRDVSSTPGGELVRVLDVFGSRAGALGRRAVERRACVGNGGLLLAEGVGIEGSIADEIEHSTVEPEASRLHGEVLGTRAHVLGGGHAGDDLELIDRVDVHVQSDGAVVTLLIESLGRNAVEVKRGLMAGGAAQ